MNDCLAKRVFIHELYKYCMTREPLCTVTTDLIRVLHKYGVYNYLHKYVVGGVFPNNKIGKQMVKHNINSNQQEIWSRGFLIIGATRFLRVHPNFVVHPLYQCLKRDMPLRNSIMNIIRMLTIVEEDEQMLCTGCDEVVTNSVDHVMMRCTALLDVHAEARIVALSDTDTIDILLGKEFPDLTQHNHIQCELYKQVGKFIHSAIAILAI